MYGQPNGFYMPNYNPYAMQNNGAVPDMLSQAKLQYSPIQSPLQPSKSGSDMIFVLNENEAGAFPVAPNNSVVLWDKNQKTFYIKTANAQGIPSMQIFDFSERAQNAPQTPTEHVCKCGDNFVTKDDFNALKGDFEALSKRFEETAVTQVTKPNKTTKKGDD